MGVLAFLFDACKKEAVAAGGGHPRGDKERPVQKHFWG